MLCGLGGGGERGGAWTAFQRRAVERGAERWRESMTGGGVRGQGRGQGAGEGQGRGRGGGRGQFCKFSRAPTRPPARLAPRPQVLQTLVGVADELNRAQAESEYRKVRRMLRGAGLGSWAGGGLVRRSRPGGQWDGARGVRVYQDLLPSTTLPPPPYAAALGRCCGRRRPSCAPRVARLRPTSSKTS
jgi:hypothetical protein